MLVVKNWIQHCKRLGKIISTFCMTSVSDTVNLVNVRVLIVSDTYMVRQYCDIHVVIKQLCTILTMTKLTIYIQLPLTLQTLYLQMPLQLPMTGHQQAHKWLLLDLSRAERSLTRKWICSCRKSHIHIKQWIVITHICFNFIRCFAKPLLK